MRCYRISRFVPVILGAVLLCAASRGTSSAQSNSPPADTVDQLLKEQTHFLECLAFVYDPPMWLSYEGSLYFAPRTEDQMQRLAEMKEARKNYSVLTNRLARYELTARMVASSGIDEKWRTKILLPYSNTNLNLTPTRELTVRYLPKYRIVQTFTGGDVMLSDGGDKCFVMGFGRAAGDAYHTNAVLVREGTKSFRYSSQEYVQTEAFTDAGLSQEEIAVLRKASKAFLAEAASPGLSRAVLARAPTNPAAATPESPASAAADEFLMHKMRARDDSPYLQFLLANDYLQGLGTPKDEKLGLEWMRRAAANGSGDAKAYLEKALQK